MGKLSKKGLRTIWGVPRDRSWDVGSELRQELETTAGYSPRRKKRSSLDRGRGTSPFQERGEVPKGKYHSSQILSLLEERGKRTTY